MDEPLYRELLKKLAGEARQYTEQFRLEAHLPVQPLGPADAAEARRLHNGAARLRDRAEELIGVIAGGQAAGRGRPMATDLKTVHDAFALARQADKVATAGLWQALGVSQS
jgi:hypothetical protein